MAPLASDEAQEFYGQGGGFTSIRKMCKPGETITVKLIDLNRDTKSKYPIKGKDYAYLLSLDKDGARMRMSVNSKNMIQQILEALYPDGPAGKLQPCFATIHRRVERKSYESEAVIKRGDTLTQTVGNDEIQL